MDIKVNRLQKLYNKSQQNTKYDQNYPQQRQQRPVYRKYYQHQYEYLQQYSLISMSMPVLPSTSTQIQQKSHNQNHHNNHNNKNKSLFDVLNIQQPQSQLQLQHQQQNYQKQQQQFQWQYSFNQFGQESVSILLPLKFNYCIQQSKLSSLQHQLFINQDINTNNNNNNNNNSIDNNKINTNNNNNINNKRKKKKQIKDKMAEYQKNICGYITKRILRQFTNQTNKSQILQLCNQYDINYEQTMLIYSNKIQKCTGLTHIYTLLFMDKSQKQIRMTIAFFRFFQYFLREKYLLSLIKEGRMINRGIYLQYKNRVLLPIIQRLIKKIQDKAMAIGIYEREVNKLNKRVRRKVEDKNESFNQKQRRVFSMTNISYEIGDKDAIFQSSGSSSSDI